MERVTKKDGAGHYYMTGDGIFLVRSIWDRFMGEDVDKIGFIEDILGDDYSLDRLRELVKSDRENRFVVLPCKVGDIAWFKTYSCNAKVCHGIQPHIVKAIRLYAIVEGEHTDVGLSAEQLNKSWFLTPESAEAALKGEQNG